MFRSSAMRSSTVGLLFAGGALAVVWFSDGQPGILGASLICWLSAFTLGSQLWAFGAAGCILLGVSATDADPGTLGLTGALVLLALVQIERANTMRRRAQTDDRVTRNGIAFLAFVLFGSFLLVALIELVLDDQVSGLLLPVGLTIGAAAIALVARILDRSADRGNADTFRPGARI